MLFQGHNGESFLGGNGGHDALGYGGERAMAAESSLFGLLCVRESWCDKGRVGEQTKAIRGDLSSFVYRQKG